MLNCINLQSSTNKGENMKTEKFKIENCPGFWFGNHPGFNFLNPNKGNMTIDPDKQSAAKKYLGKKATILNQYQYTKGFFIEFIIKSNCL